MKSCKSPRLRRVSAKQVAKLKARYLGAGKRVNTHNKSISKITDTINNRSDLKLVNGVTKRVRLTAPELDDLRDRRNILQAKLVEINDELKDYKDAYLRAVGLNMQASRDRLGKTRIAVKDKNGNNILKKVQSILTKAAENGGRENVVNLMNDAKNNISEAEFKKHVKTTTGVYIPKYVDLSKLRDVLSTWEIKALAETVSE